MDSRKFMIISIIIALILGIGMFILRCISDTKKTETINNEVTNNIIENKTTYQTKITKLDNIMDGAWQGVVTFPDWKGYVDDTLAMNSMYSFDGYKDQGKIYLTIDDKVESFEMFFNNKEINTKEMISGTYEIDVSTITKNGTNTIQVCNIIPNDLKDAITVYIPYPVVIDGTLEEVGLSHKPFDLISEIIDSDINNGFSSSQLAVIKDGKLVYQNSWGLLNSYNQDGSRIEDGTKVSNDTMYDLASVTKMYSVAYAIQYLIDNDKLKLDDKIVDIIGKDFVDNTVEIKYASFKNYPGFSKIKEWKSNITILDVLKHQAGFPDSGHYHNQKYDAINQTLVNNVDNILYVENATKEETLKEGICKTPLIYEPNTNLYIRILTICC